MKRSHTVKCSPVIHTEETGEVVTAVSDEIPRVQTYVAEIRNAGGRGWGVNVEAGCATFGIFSPSILRIQDAIVDRQLIRCGECVIGPTIIASVLQY